MNNYTLSICIPTYNRCASLKELLSFFKKEKCFNNPLIQIVISNNNSSDDTSILLDDYKKFYNVMIINQTVNIGGPLNQVALLKLSSGKFVWLVGDDDEIADGTIEKVLYLINKYKDLHHIFINYSEYFKKTVLNDRVFKGKVGYYKSGIELFSNVATNSSLSPLMFMTANIYLLSDVMHANSILEKNNNIENFALTLCYSLKTSEGPGYILDDYFIKDQINGASWSYYSWRVWCRDMVLVCDLISEGKDYESKIFNLVRKGLPFKYPELIYIIKGYKYKKDNYALKMYLKKHKIRLFFDCLAFPFFCFFFLLKQTLLSKIF